MIAEEGLEGRVEMVGAVPHEKARDLLVSLPAPACPLICRQMIKSGKPLADVSLVRAGPVLPIRKGNICHSIGASPAHEDAKHPHQYAQWLSRRSA